ncbi:MAG TPA: stage II sporulation protein P [Syntrophothermus lipocalidus]|nr:MULTISPECIES: stage II sporulation protein P [Syntrophothermus]NSW81957.1 stage II sporulation protein P [Syntrophothermus sp.]HHV75919.1 stage II sporulation protein P [Syntrophothermus lipocalidus]
MSKKWLVKLLVITILTTVLSAGPNVKTVLAETERTDGSYFTLIGEKGQVLDCTALTVSVGDEYITPSNDRYKVTRIVGNKAYCEYVGKEKMPEFNNNTVKSSVLSVLTAFNKKRPLVAIYHTHNDEAFVPSDGTESRRGGGGIIDVGETLRKKLEAMGVRVIHDTTSHEPHDANAYYRSRRTAVKLLKKGASLLVDVHRDSVPPDVYRTTVKGNDVTKVKLVIGRQNANINSNLEFAKRLKAQMDQAAPGLSGGIFLGKGNYNQDLTPRAVLVEVGADSNRKTEAEKGVALFAQSLAPVLGIDAKAAEKPLLNQEKGQRKSDWTTVLWVVVAAGIIYAGYVYLNRNRA